MADVNLTTESEKLVITLARPECGNLVTDDSIHKLAEALRTAPSNIKVIVIQSEGDDFCLGRDYSIPPEDLGRTLRHNALEIQEKLAAPILGLFTSIKEAPAPTVSIVRGRARGFGCALACACEIVIASNNARLSLPELHERSLPPTFAMTALFDRVQIRQLTYLVYSGSELDAQAALSAGFVSHVCVDEQIVAESQKLIDSICMRPLEATRGAKRYLRLAHNMDHSGRAELGSSIAAVLISSL